jgi:Na+-driven multidrug efflux pump
MFLAVSNGALRGYLDTATPLLVAILAFIIDYSIDPHFIYPQGEASEERNSAAKGICAHLLVY